MNPCPADTNPDKRASCTDEPRVDARAVALAAAIEALASGHVRVLAAELRGLLEAAQVSSAEVIPIRGREPKR